MPKTQKGQAAVLSHDEFKRLLKIISSSKHAKRNTLLVLLSFGTGMRAVEMAALRVCDVLKDNGSIIEEITLRRTKGNKPRPIFITDPRLTRALMDYIDERRDKQSKLAFSTSQPLLMSQKKTGFTARNLQKLFEEIYRKCGLKGASSHSGRRTFATRLIEMGTDIKTVSTLMGHSSVSMTAKYVEANPIRMRRVVAKALY